MERDKVRRLELEFRNYPERTHSCPALLYEKLCSIQGSYCTYQDRGNCQDFLDSFARESDSTPVSQGILWYYFDKIRRLFK